MPNVGTQAPKILVKLNDTVLKEFEITHTQFTVGRKADNDLVIENPAVSSHHARIVKVQQVYFLEDLKSTNGTFINDKRIDRQQLQDTDVVAIGKHRLIFRDEIPQGTGPATAEFDPDKTMVLKSPKASDQPTAAPKVGIVQIISGRTDRKEYQLTGHLTIIGSQKHASIKIKGWFAPKIAAMVGRRGTGYFISASDEVKTICVNHHPVKGQVDLKDGDLLEVGKVTMYFYMKNAGKP